jgi:hypothetical protein
MMRKFALTLAALGLLASAALAEAVIKPRTMGFSWLHGTPHITYSARDLINFDAQKKLDSGLPQRIVVQHFVYGPKHATALAAGGHSCRVVYDLWQTAYRIELEVFGKAPKNEVVSTRVEVLERCLVMRTFPLGQAVNFSDVEQVYVASLIELNPLSTATIARIRRWLSRPRGDEGLQGRSFFGSFVSLFVNDRIGTAERVLRLRSQDVERR